MSELCLGVAPSLDSTKGLEEGRVMLDQSLDFMTYLFPLHILLTWASWSQWSVSSSCLLRCPEQPGQWAYNWR